MNIFWRSVSDMNVKAVVKYEYCLVYMFINRTKTQIIISHTVYIPFDTDVKLHLFPLIKTDIVAFFIMEKIVALLFPLYLISQAKRRIILEIQYLSCSVQECCILLLNRYAFYI